MRDLADGRLLTGAVIAAGEDDAIFRMQDSLAVAPVSGCDFMVGDGGVRDVSDDHLSVDGTPVSRREDRYWRCYGRITPPGSFRST